MTDKVKITSDGKVYIDGLRYVPEGSAPTLEPTQPPSTGPLAVFTADNVDALDITNLHTVHGGRGDKILKFKLRPLTEGAALVAYINGGSAYSYASLTVDNDTAMGGTLESRGPKIYGANIDDRAHITPNYLSNLVGDNGVTGRMYINDPHDDTVISRVHGFGSFTEGDDDTDAVMFAFSRKDKDKLETLQLRFRNKSGGGFISFSGTVEVMGD